MFFQRTIPPASSRQPNRYHRRRWSRLVAAGCALALTACGSSESAGSEPELDDQPLITQAGVVFPIADGELDNWRDALADLIGPNYADYESSRARFGLTQQTTVLQATPMGNFALIYMEGPDIADTTQQMATSPEGWDIEWREMTSGLHGADFNNPDEIAIDVHLVLDTGNLDTGAKQATTPMMFFIPLSQENAGSVRARLEDLMSDRGDEYRSARAEIGVSEEKVFLQNTAVGPGLVVYWEAADPKASLDSLLASTNPFDQWFQAEFAQFHAVPTDLLQEIWSQNALIADFPARS